MDDLDASGYLHKNKELRHAAVSALQSGFSIIKCQGKKMGTSHLPSAYSAAADPARCCCSENKKGHKIGMVISKYPRGTSFTPALRGGRGLFSH